MPPRRMVRRPLDRQTEVTNFAESTKPIRGRISRRCLVCGRRIQVAVHMDDTCRAGEYFGRVPEFAMRKRHGGYDPLVAEDNSMHSDEYWGCASCARK